MLETLQGTEQTKVLPPQSLYSDMVESQWVNKSSQAHQWERRGLEEGGEGGGWCFGWMALWGCTQRLEGSWDRSDLLVSLRACFYHSRLCGRTQALSALPVAMSRVKLLALIICFQTKLNFNRKCSLLGVIQEGSARRNLPLGMLNCLGSLAHPHPVGIWGMQLLPSMQPSQVPVESRVGPVIRGRLLPWAHSDTPNAASSLGTRTAAASS